MRQLLLNILSDYKFCQGPNVLETASDEQGSCAGRGNHKADVASEEIVLRSASGARSRCRGRGNLRSR
jgi:hypothetical protein